MYNTTTITSETRLIDMTAGELTTLIQSAMGAQKLQDTPPTKQLPRYVYGLAGIRHLFNVSHVTAQRYKDGILKPAVKQYGRKLVIDVDKALKLFDAQKRK